MAQQSHYINVAGHETDMAAYVLTDRPMMPVAVRNAFEIANWLHRWPSRWHVFIRVGAGVTYAPLAPGRFKQDHLKQVLVSTPRLPSKIDPQPRSGHAEIQKWMSVEGICNKWSSATA